MNTTTDRRRKATQSFIEKAHRIWHEVRSIPVCKTLKCEHPWYG